MTLRDLLVPLLILVALVLGACGATDDAERLAPVLEAQKKGDPAKALALIEKIEAEGQPSEALGLHKGIVLEELGRRDEARSSFEKTLAAHPQSGRALFFLGENLRRAGRLDEARKRLERAKELLPRDGAVWNALGLVEAATKSYDEAIRCYDRALALDPRSYTIYYNLGEAYRKADQLANAREALEKALKLAPPHTAPILFSLGETLFYLSRFADARRHYARLLAAAPRFERLGRVYFQLARIYYREKRFKEALDLIRLAERRSYDAGAVSLWMGKCLLKLGRAEKAFEALEKARATQPAPPELDYYLGIASIRLRRYREAHVHFLACLAAELPEAEVRAQLGVVRLKQFQTETPPPELTVQQTLDEARKHFAGALEKDPTNLVALFGSAQVAFESKDYNGCLNLVDRLLAAANDFPQGLLLTALCFHELGQDEKAVLPLERYRLTAPRNARVTFFLAELLSRIEGKESRAVELFQTGLRLDPNDHYARLIFSRLLARQGRFTAAAEQLNIVIEHSGDGPLRNEARRLYTLLTETLRSSFAPPPGGEGSPLSMDEARRHVEGARTVSERARKTADRGSLHAAIEELVTLFQRVRAHPRLDGKVRDYLRDEIRRLVEELRTMR